MTLLPPIHPIPFHSPLLEGASLEKSSLKKAGVEAKEKSSSVYHLEDKQNIDKIVAAAYRVLSSLPPIHPIPFHSPLLEGASLEKSSLKKAGVEAKEKSSSVYHLNVNQHIDDLDTAFIEDKQNIDKLVAAAYRVLSLMAHQQQKQSKTQLEVSKLKILESTEELKNQHQKIWLVAGGVLASFLQISGAAIGFILPKDTVIFKGTAEAFSQLLTASSTLPREIGTQVNSHNSGNIAKTQQELQLKLQKHESDSQKDSEKGGQKNQLLQKMQELLDLLIRTIREMWT